MNLCGSCSLCCKTHDIAGFKPQNVVCRHAAPGTAAGCCTIYAARPPACAGFSCLYIETQKSPWPWSAEMRPDRCHVVFGPEDIELQQLLGPKPPPLLFAHVDPDFPDAWDEMPARGMLLAALDRGAMVVVIVGSERILLERHCQPWRGDESTIREMIQARWRLRRLPLAAA